MSFISCLFTGKDKYKEVKNENLQSAFILNSSSTFQGYFYNGSDSVYHYFVAKWDLQRDEYFKILVSNFTVIKPFKFKEGKQEQRIDFFKSGNEEFGRNKFYKLYLQ